MPVSVRNTYILAFLICLAGSFLLYLPLLDNQFLSDDYDALYRLFVEHRIQIRGIFRPVTDIAFYLNYLLTGLNPFGFYLVNICLHGLNAFLVFVLFTRLFNKSATGNSTIAACTALLFLVYPFHNEGIAWLTGRIASISAALALCSLLILAGKKISKGRLFVSALLYFLSTLTYESNILLPVVIGFLFFKELRESRLFAFAFFVFLVTSLAYLAMRYMLGGELLGSYGARMISHSRPSPVAFNLFKTLARSFLPPQEKSWILVAAFCILTVIVLIIHWRYFRKFKANCHLYIELVGCYFTAIVVPVLFGISSRTSEGDRLLYFPSIFVCAIISVWILSIIKRSLLRGATIGVIATGWIVLLQLNNSNWNSASNVATQLLSIARENKDRKIFVVNLPEEQEGAPIFRNGFTKALAFHKLNEQNVEAVNMLSRLEYLNAPGVIRPTISQSRFFIYPETYIADTVLNTFNEPDKIILKYDPHFLYFYFDRKELRQFTKP